MTGVIIMLIVIGVLIGASGQLLIKKGLTQIGEIKIPDIKAAIPTAFNVLTNKLVFLGLLCSVLSSFFWLIALSKTDLSLSYPISLGLFIIVITIFSWLLLKESMTFAKITGIIVVFIGIIILAK